MTQTLIQCDFDDTVTYKDISLLLLEEYAGYEWRDLWDAYQEGKITVGRFNELAFGMVKASRQEMLDFIRDRFKIRPGFSQFTSLCRQKDYRLVIVSNGLDFYIGEALKNIGSAGLEFHAAETVFDPEGLRVRYVSHDGTVLDRDFKLSYTNLFLQQGYRVVYIGDGNSDLEPARKCHYVFATDMLLKHCRRQGIACTPFADFNDIVRVMRTW